nr:toprim domain-containing protein [Fimbriiglobus sp.]
MPARKKPAADSPATPKKPATKKATSTAVSKATPKRTAAEATDAPAPSRGGYDLVIIESAGKVKAITKYLGRGFKVLPSYGHVRDLATGKDKTVKEEVSGIQIGKGWKMRYLVDAGSKAKNANDPDREGESIAWHIADQLHLDPARTFRIRFNEITKKAI